MTPTIASPASFTSGRKSRPVFDSTSPTIQELGCASRDVKGHGFIHLDEDYKPWLDAMLPHIHRYLELLRLRTEYLGIFFSALVAGGDETQSDGSRPQP